ncbi:alpha/beta hydrolase [Rhodococcus sp. HNM0569]|uniref:alpha/beta fold hydrolase n=1 Tax=Rhodococcus sp. HNM0569 TaxID=2716340 RepID=UPI00146BC32C|nr:alpha/beta hydrolase [Rhodococcus sp. HNM0569]NLU82234.1 alpha/beta hydrolase [Rhodococcus sp. HNM0569]
MTDYPEAARDPIVCLHDRPGAAHWYADQIDALGARVVETADVLDARDGASVDRWVAAAARDIEADAPAHVLATATAAYAAIVLASRHPHLVRSLLLGDPQIPHDDAEYRQLLASVHAPTLVIASAPDQVSEAAEESRLAVPQGIAGGIDNGVFVVIDGCDVPAHRERGSSFHEWVTSFTIIAEGLGALGQRRQEEAHV